MKVLKKKIIWTVVIGLMGAALLLVSIFQNGSSASTGFASGLIVISILRLIQFYRISKNPKLLKRYEIEQKEERLITISEKSGRYTFLLTIAVEFCGIILFTLLKQNEIATILSFAVGTKIVIYLIIYYYLSKNKL